MKRYIVIGASAASIGVLSRLRGKDEHASIVCIAGQKEMPYNTCLLADYIAGNKSLHDIQTKDAAFFEKNRIELHLQTWVQDLDATARIVRCKAPDGTMREFGYDALFLGTGTAMVAPPIVGLKEYQGVFGFHTLEHAQGLQDYIAAHAPTNAVVIGAGLSGVECADALLARGMHVTLIEQASRILPALIDDGASHMLVATLRQRGVSVRLMTSVRALEGSNGRVTDVVLMDGTRIAAQVVIVATGSRAQNQLACAAGLTMRDGRIVVNEYMQTSDAAIFAAGDSCLMPHVVTGELVPNTLWPDAMVQGMHAAMAMAGSPKAYEGILPITSSRFFGTAFAGSGSIAITHEGDSLITDINDEHYYIFKLHNQQLVGFLMVGKLKAIGALRTLMLHKVSITAAQLRLIE